MRTTLPGVLASIPAPPELGSGDPVRYYVRRIPTTPSHFFGRDGHGFPCLLLATSDEYPKAPMLLEEIEVRFAVPCRVVLSAHEGMRETLTTVCCTSRDRVLQDYFAHTCEAIVHMVGPSPTLGRVIDAVRRLVDLFQRLSLPSSRSVFGLVAELYVIYASRSPRTAVEAWHSKIDERFDFSIDDVRIEVKASSTRQRTHHFSLEQCEPPPATLGILVSVFVETSGGGLSLVELLEGIERKVEDDVDLVLKLRETVAGTLGSAAAKALPMRFDEELLKSSFRVYELAAIPAVRSVPSEISQVHFCADISRSPTAEVVALCAQHPKARALLPNRSWT